ncbi:MAG: hypothetical protein ACK5JR_13435, partial [Tropicimonas sp.]
MMFVKGQALSKVFQAQSAIVVSEMPELSVAETPSFDAQLSAHRVYNFEVKDHHTYIAGGIRVHNTSILNYLKPNEFDYIKDIDTENGSVTDVYVQYEGSNAEIHMTLTNENGTSQVLREVTFSDGAGNMLYQRQLENADGSYMTYEPVRLSGQEMGGQVAETLAPFLSRALMGDNDSLFSKVAANTILGTMLQNVGQVIGGAIHRGIVDVDDMDLEMQIDTAAKVSFENFGGELVINGAEAAVSVVNQLIMAEVFEAVGTNTAVKRIYAEVMSRGLNTVMINGTKAVIDTQFFVEVFDGLGFSDASIKTIQSWAQKPADFNPVTFVISAIINEVLPDLKTMEGGAASTLTATAVSIFYKLLGLSEFAAGPVGMIIGYFVGAFFDALFEKEPQAWTKVGFDADTGRFVLLGTWSDDGGNTGISQSLAEIYVKAMNGFVDTMMSKSNNYDDLAQWSFGHFEDALKNAGRDGKTFGDFQETYIDAYMTDIEAVVLKDGQMAAVRALAATDLPQLAKDFNDWGWLHALDEVFSSRGVLRDNGGEYIRATHASAALHEVYQALAQAHFGRSTITLVDANAMPRSSDGYVVSPERTVDAGTLITDEIIEDVLAIKNITTFRDFLQFFVKYLETMVWEDHPARETMQDTLTDKIKKLLARGGWESIEELSEFSGVPATVHGLLERYQIVSSNLQIADDYHTYLENQDAIDTMIRLSPESKFAGGWVATLSAAKELGLTDRYNLRGDALDNVFYTANGNDVVRGYGGNDEIKTYGGEDVIYGGDGNDVLDGGAGVDKVYGEAGNDVVMGGPGADLLDGGTGRDRAAYRNATGGVTINLSDPTGNTGDAANDTYVGIEAYEGSTFDDVLIGTNGNNTFYGGAGNDILVGGRGADKLVGGEGRDLARYRDAEAPVIVDLMTPSANTGEAAGDTYDSIENVSGTRFADVINGDNASNYLWGHDGNDVLRGRGGDDILFGGRGNDRLIGNSGTDQVSYWDMEESVQVDLADHTLNQGGARGDIYDSIENAGGTNLNDQLRGDGGANGLWGHAGNDVLDGRGGDDTLTGGAGADRLIGGAGVDTASYADANSRV